MQILVELPDDLAEHAEAGREALEAFAIACYRAETLTPYQTRVLLGLPTRSAFDGFLKEHEVFDHSYGVEELMEDVRNLCR